MAVARDDRAPHAALDSQKEELNTTLVAGPWNTLPEDHFRLLRINREIEGKLYCSVAPFLIGRKRPYIAISYSCGRPELPKFVDPVTADLRRRLYQLTRQRDTWPEHIQYGREAWKIGPEDEEDGEDQGIRDAIHAIDLNGITIQVGQNLFDLLQELKSEETQVDYWIDALCIHQADEQEKADQVNRMASI